MFTTSATPTHFWAFSSQGSPTRECSFRLKAAYRTRKPLQGERSIFYASLYRKGEKKNNTWCWPKIFLQPAATATMPYHPENNTHPPLPVSVFLLAQKLSSKWIVPTDYLTSGQVGWWLYLPLVVKGLIIDVLVWIAVIIHLPSCFKGTSCVCVSHFLFIRGPSTLSSSTVFSSDQEIDIYIS